MQKIFHTLQTEYNTLQTLIYPGGFYKEGPETRELCKRANKIAEILEAARVAGIKRKIRAYITAGGYERTTRAAFVRELTARERWEAFNNAGSMGARSKWEQHSNHVCAQTSSGQKTYHYFNSGDSYYKNAADALAVLTCAGRVVLEYKPTEGC